jgi:hypothetical protein
MLKNIKASFATSGLIPFNPDKILRNMPALLTKLVILSANKLKIRFYRQDIELQMLVTLVLVEAFILLQNLII